MIKDTRKIKIPKATNHDSGVFWAPNNGRENGTRSIITGKASFAHAGSVINNKSLNVFVGHSATQNNQI